jgi:hypothetical protein
MLLVAAACLGQAASPLDPDELVRRTVRNEVRAANDATDHLQFRSTKTTPKDSITRIYVQTKDATAGMTIAYDGKPLTAEQRKAEEERLQGFLRDPEVLHKKRNQEHEDSERTMRIVRAIPHAFLFQYAGEEQSSAGVGRPGHSLVKLTFRPNPSYQPPSRVEQVLVGMEGFVLIDADAGRLATIDGSLFRDVGFGWGILGHLDKGGHFLVQQAQESSDIWAVTRMHLKFNGKILLFKSLVIDSNEVFSDFQRVPADLTFAQAVEMLRKEEFPEPVTTNASRNSQ